MVNLGRKIVKLRFVIFIASIVLLIPAAIGYINTKVNYDILYYLPDHIETMIGQDILVDEFGTGAYSMFICEGMPNRDVAALKEKIEKTEHVSKVVWYDSFSDLSVPMEMLPEKIRKVFNSGDSTMMFIIFETTTSADETMDAIEEIRHLAGKQSFLSGMSAIVTDTKNLAEKEVVAYVAIASLLSIIVLGLTMESYLIPVLFLTSIGFAIIYNLGSNFIAGEISYITKALTAVLQLGVTMDYSIFLWHSYEENQERYPDDKNRAMAHAISQTVTSVVGSSITTIAGFLAMCFMTFTLGMDLGIVMAKGVVFGVIGCVTILPAMILAMDKWLEKTKHKPLMPDLGRIGGFVAKHYPVFIVLFLAGIGPMYYAQGHNEVYYDLVGTLPKELGSVEAGDALEHEFGMGAAHVILADSELPKSEAFQMEKELKEVDGVKLALGLDALTGPLTPAEFVPDRIKEKLNNGTYQMIYVLSEYKTGTDEVNAQCDAIREVIKKYDETAMLIGEAPCTQDLITITDRDFKIVNAASIVLIFLIIAIVLKSASLPVILVLVIEFAIFINMGIPYFTNTVLPFIASIVIGTIQLGATVDYAILMTNKYKRERSRGAGKREAVITALNSSLQSVAVSALSFFAATFGVALYSSIDMISSLCMLLARGAVISLLVVAFLLPAMFLMLDKCIVKTSIGFLPKIKNKN